MEAVALEELLTLLFEKYLGDKLEGMISGSSDNTAEIVKNLDQIEANIMLLNADILNGNQLQLDAMMLLVGVVIGFIFYTIAEKAIKINRSRKRRGRG